LAPYSHSYLLNQIPGAGLRLSQGLSTRVPRHPRTKRRQRPNRLSHKYIRETVKGHPTDWRAGLSQNGHHTGLLLQVQPGHAPIQVFQLLQRLHPAHVPGSDYTEWRSFYTYGVFYLRVISVVLGMGGLIAVFHVCCFQNCKS